MKTYRALLIFVTLFSFSIISCKQGQKSLSKEDVDKQIESWLRSNPEKMVEILTELSKKQAEIRKKQEDERQAKELEDKFKNPVKISAGDSPSKGPADAKITIIEFSDFECPFCNRARITADQIMEKYKGQIKLVFKNQPLPFHQNAIPAAKAALAAGEQGKFWEFHDKVFVAAGERDLNDARYEKIANEIGLNLDQFKKDYASDKIDKAVKKDMEEAKKYGVQGTPAFFVNGIMIEGAYPVEYFSKIIDRLLK